MMTETEEQARLLGMSAEREAKLLAEIESLRKDAQRREPAMTDYSALHIATLEALRDSYAAALKKDFDGARRLSMSGVNSFVRLSREYERIQDDYELTEQTADKC